MKSPATAYVRGIHQKFDFYAAWPPNERRMLGDVGRLVGGQFQRLTTLGKLGVTFAERAGPPGSDLSHTSGSSVSVQFKAQGESVAGLSIPPAKAGATLEFSASGAYVFQALTPAVNEIEDQVHLADDILALYRKKNRAGKRSWEEDWCVITALLTADRVTVLVSSSKNSRVELAADGAIPVGPAPLASAGVGLAVVTQTGEVTSVLAAANLTPMFRLSRVRRSVLDRLMGGDNSAALGRAAAGATQVAPRRVLESVPLAEALAQAAPRQTAERMLPPAVKKKTGKKKAATAAGRSASARTTTRSRPKGR